MWGGVSEGVEGGDEERGGLGARRVHEGRLETWEGEEEAWEVGIPWIHEDLEAWDGVSNGVAGEEEAWRLGLQRVHGARDLAAGEDPRMFPGDLELSCILVMPPGVSFNAPAIASPSEASVLAVFCSVFLCVCSWLFGCFSV